MAVRVPVHSSNTGLGTIGYGDYLASGAAYAIRDVYNTAGTRIPFGTAVTINSVNSTGTSIVTAAHGTITLLPWEPFPFSFNTSLSGSAFNNYIANFNTFLTPATNKIQYWNGTNTHHSQTF